MVAERTLVDLHAADLPWRSITIPGSAPKVGLVRLHADTRTSASVSLVRFPAGWDRPGVGHYQCAELFVVLDGSIEVSGVHYAEGYYGYLPARASRIDSRSREGCLAVGWFSAVPAWSADPPLVPPDEAPRRGRLGAPGQPLDIGGGACRCDRVPAGPVAVTTELLWPGSGKWCLVPSGALPPALPGTALLRRWP
jgi:hypothetical protein